MQKNHNEPEMPSSVFVALVGRPNVGKSSLTNHLVGEKVAIVTQKAQTTRNRITGIITKGPVQYVLLDTPGIHKPRNRLDSRMTQTAAASLKDVDVTLMLFEPTGEFTESELGMVEALRKAGPAIAVINKVDLLNDFAALEARKKQVEEFGIFDAIVTVSAKDGTGCEELFPLLKQYANPGPHYFDDDAFTDMPEKELVAELVREKALLFMREEIPHGIAVTVESFKERPDSDLIDISVEICCERKSHKGMIIGKGGQMLKKIASAARMDCEELLGARVNLQCWVKVREDWRDNDRLLDNLGFAKPSQWGVCANPVQPHGWTTFPRMDRYDGGKLIRKGGGPSCQEMLKPTESAPHSGRNLLPAAVFMTTLITAALRRRA